MKKVCITYHMEKPGEEAETCITLPMIDFAADDIVALGNGSDYLQPNGRSRSSKGRIHRILCQVCALQGYRFTEAVHFQVVD